MEAFKNFEKEVGLGITPIELTEKTTATISLKQATTILEKMGIKMPANITLENMTSKLMELPIMSNSQIRKFTFEALKHVRAN